LAFTPSVRFLRVKPIRSQSFWGLLHYVNVIASLLRSLRALRAVQDVICHPCQLIRLDGSQAHPRQIVFRDGGEMNFVLILTRKSLPASEAKLLPQRASACQLS
jgi:hypothetical protein